MKNKNFIRKRQAIYISPNQKSTRIIKTLMDFFFFIKVKIKMVCFSVPSSLPGGRHIAHQMAYGSSGSDNRPLQEKCRWIQFFPSCVKLWIQA